MHRPFKLPKNRRSALLVSIAQRPKSELVDVFPVHLVPRGEDIKNGFQDKGAFAQSAFDHMRMLSAFHAWSS